MLRLIFLIEKLGVEHIIADKKMLWVLLKRQKSNKRKADPQKPF